MAKRRTGTIAWNIDDILSDNRFLISIVKTVHNVKSWIQLQGFDNIHTILFQESIQFSIQNSLSRVKQLTVKPPLNTFQLIFK